MILVRYRTVDAGASAQDFKNGGLGGLEYGYHSDERYYFVAGGLAAAEKNLAVPESVKRWSLSDSSRSRIDSIFNAQTVTATYKGTVELNFDRVAVFQVGKMYVGLQENRWNIAGRKKRAKVTSQPVDNWVQWFRFVNGIALAAFRPHDFSPTQLDYQKGLGVLPTHVQDTLDSLNLGKVEKTLDNLFADAFPLRTNKAGKTMYASLPSFEVDGGQVQRIGDLLAYTFTVGDREGIYLARIKLDIKYDWPRDRIAVKWRVSGQWGLEEIIDLTKNSLLDEKTWNTKGFKAAVRAIKKTKGRRRR